MIDKADGRAMPVELLALDVGLTLTEMLETLEHFDHLGYTSLDDGVVSVSEWKVMFPPSKCDHLYLGKTTGGWFKIGVTKKPAVRFWQLQHKPDHQDEFEYISVFQFKEPGAATFTEKGVKKLLSDSCATKSFSTEYFKGDDVLDKVVALIAEYRKQHRNEDVTSGYTKKALCGLSC
ncbi:prolyl-tRNA synthetase [Erwinia phage pEp_SNUABM_01]|uniref:Prolyl-tRNA synthetase n=1 Tax=Erwinia phage pEp_SNUABM_01 TaxID=2601643 RepID=A0A5J6DAK2_9CAUD|nr:prolyl-tRNA synthetase [Erwinia phage pEp_SNUABM_01]QEQ94827.1 prolyl-tRNA synthetase [Erwinia phage pEp_SNUABM_01]